VPERTFPDIAPAEAPWIGSPPIAADIYPTDSGEYGLGLDGPSFPSRRFAESVRLQRTHHRQRWESAQ
jgi:hypothetical protein